MDNNTPTPIVDDWDAHWTHFDESASANPAQRYRHRLLGRMLARWRPRRLLDIGSGQGDLLAQLHRSLPNMELFGLEMSATGVQRTLSKVPTADVRRVNLFDHDAASRIADIKADTAVCSEVLEHLDDPVAFLRSAAAALAPGATLLVTVPSGPRSEFDRLIGHRRHYTRNTLRGLLQSAGFTVVRLDYAGFPFFNLYRLVVIGRGRRLADDVAAGSTSRVANIVMRAFYVLFHLNLARSRWGWQVIAVARWPVDKAGASRGD